MSEPADPTCVILPRRRGRPPAPPTVPASTRLSMEDMDRVIMLASRHDMKVAAFLREIVTVYIRDRELLY